MSTNSLTIKKERGHIAPVAVISHSGAAPAHYIIIAPVAVISHSGAAPAYYIIIAPVAVISHSGASPAFYIIIAPVAVISHSRAAPAYYIIEDKKFGQVVAKFYPERAEGYAPPFTVPFFIPLPTFVSFIHGRNLLPAIRAPAYQR
jgi:hypothetical protein